MSQEDYFEGISLRQLLFHPAVWLLVATAGMIFGATQLWDSHRYKIAHPSKYEISRSNVAINEPPKWYVNDLYDELYNHVLNSSTLLDQHIVPETATYLGSIPWVQKVENVNKNPNGLSIRLKYRNPIAFVCNGDRSQTLVDSQGVVFDSRLLTPMDAARLDNSLLKISIPLVDLGTLQPWQTSADERIEHAAQLCEVIAENANDLKLFRIVTFDLPALGTESGPELEIWTRNGVRVLWGHAPGFEAAEESDYLKKIEAIRAFVVHHGPLIQFDAKRQQMIDVRSGIAKLIAIRRSAEADLPLGTLK